jgi:hypothetical protein
MKAGFQAYKGKAEPYPEVFYPSTPGYVVHKILPNGTVWIPGGWSESELLSAKRAGRMYRGNEPERIPEGLRSPFSEAVVEEWHAQREALGQRYSSDFQSAAKLAKDLSENATKLL